MATVAELAGAAPRPDTVAALAAAHDQPKRRKKRGLLESHPLYEDGQVRFPSPHEVAINALKETGRTAVGVSQLARALLNPAMEVTARVREAQRDDPPQADPYSTLAGKVVAGTRAGVGEMVRQIERAASLPDRAGEVIAQVPGLVAKGAGEVAEDPLKAALEVASTAYENPIGAVTVGSLATRQVARAALPVIERLGTEGRAIERAAAAGVEMPEVFESSGHSLATALQRVKPTVESMAQSPIRTGVEAAKGAIREKQPALAEALGFARGQAEVRELRGLEASSELARNNRFTQAVARTFQIPDEELNSFARIVQGVDPLPDDASDGLRRAIDWYRAQDIENTTDLIRRGWLTPDEAHLRAYAPLRIERFAAEKGGDLKAGYKQEASLVRAAEREEALDARKYESKARKLALRYQRTADRLEALDKERAATAGWRGSALASRSAVESRLHALDSEIAELAQEHSNLATGFRHMAIEGTPPAGAMTARVRGALRRRLGRRGEIAEAGELQREMREILARQDYPVAARRLRAVASQLLRNRARARRLWQERYDVAGTARGIKTTGIGPATLKLHQVTDEIAAERLAHGKPAPMYFPHLPDATVQRTRTQVLTEEIRRYLPSSLRRSVGKLFAFDQYEKNPRVALVRHDREMNHWRMYENMIDEITADNARFPKRVLKKRDQLRPDEVLFAPDLPKEIARRNLRFSAAMAADEQSIDAGFYAAFKQAVREAGDPANVELIRSGRLYAMPRAAVQELINQSRPSPWFIRAFWDRPTDYWRTLTLALRPAWIVNNAVGNGLFSTLHGVGPEHWRMAMQERWIAKTPDAMGTGGLSREMAMESTAQLGSVADPAFAQKVWGMWQRLERHPAALPVARTAEALRSFNNTMEDVARRANFWKAAEKQARLNYMKRTGDRFWRSYELMQEYDRLSPTQVRAAIREANSFINDYVNGLTWYERALVRRVVPFYSFLKHQVRLQLMLPTDYPGRTAALKALVEMHGEADEDAKIPQSMKNQGVIRTPFTFEVGGRTLRAYVGTLGANPLIVGGGPGTEFGELALDPREIYALLMSQAHPAIQAGEQYRTRRDPFGRPFTHPRVVKSGDRFYQIDEAGRRVTNERGRMLEAPPPVPSIPEALARAIPQSRLARALVEPRATWTGAPFSIEPKVDQRSLTEATRLSTVMGYLGVPVVLVDETTGERIVLREERRQPRRDYRAVAREGRRRQRAKEDRR